MPSRHRRHLVPKVFQFVKDDLSFTTVKKIGKNGCAIELGLEIDVDVSRSLDLFLFPESETSKR